MAKIYLLSDEHIKNGTRPKTPKQKQRKWSYICLVLTAFIVLENIFLMYRGIK